MEARDALFDLAGRVAVVTGASSGLGEHFVRVLRERAPKSSWRVGAPTGLRPSLLSWERITPSQLPRTSRTRPPRVGFSIEP